MAAIAILKKKKDNSVTKHAIQINNLTNSTILAWQIQWNAKMNIFCYDKFNVMAICRAGNLFCD